MEEDQSMTDCIQWIPKHISNGRLLWAKRKEFWQKSTVEIEYPKWKGGAYFVGTFPCMSVMKTLLKNFWLEYVSSVFASFPWRTHKAAVRSPVNSTDRHSKLVSFTFSGSAENLYRTHIENVQSKSKSGMYII